MTNIKKLLFCILTSVAMSGVAFAGLTWQATEGSTPEDCKIIWTDTNSGATFGIAISSAELTTIPCLRITGDTRVSVSLAWDANTEANLAGYKIHEGLESRRYSKHYDVGNVTEHTVTGLTPGTVYYFAATAYNETEESDYSNEVKWSSAAPAEIIIDNRDTGNTFQTGGWVGSGATGFHGTDSVYNKRDGTFMFFVNDLSPGTYKVWMWSTYWASRCQRVPVRISEGRGDGENVYIDQRTKTRDWVLLGEFPVSSGRIEITLTAQPGCSTCADAVKIRKQ